MFEGKKGGQEGREISENVRERGEREEAAKRVMVLIDRGLIENWVKFKVVDAAETIDVDSSSFTSTVVSSLNLKSALGSASASNLYSLSFFLYFSLKSDFSLPFSFFFSSFIPLRPTTDISFNTHNRYAAV